MFFSKLTSQRHAMKSALAAASPLLAFHVQDHPVQQTAEPIAPRQRYERYFTIAGSPASHAKGVVPAIDHLVVSAPGVTFVSYDATATVPSVKVSGEVPEVIEAYEVVEHGASGLEVRLRNRLDSRHYVLTEVSLPIAQALRTLETRGSGTVVVEDGVLPTNDPHSAVAIRLSGSGDVFANSLSDVRVGSLTLDLAGSGDIQFVAPSVTLRDAFETRVSSSGDARVFVGSITTSRVALSTAGSGGMQIAALSLEALAELNASVSGSGSIRMIGESLKTDTIQSSIAGSGGLKLVTNTELVANTVRASVSGSGTMDIASTNARCADGKFSVAGSGTVDARDLVAQYAAANVSGSGAILVRADAAVEAVTSGSGSIAIVGDLPPRVTGSPRTQTVEQKPSKLEALAAKRSPSKPNPTRVEAFEKLPRLNGTFHVQSFSDFVDAVKMVWNGQKDDRVEIQMKLGSGASESDEPRTHTHP